MIKINSTHCNSTVVTLRCSNPSSTTGRLFANEMSWPCVVGKGGLKSRKREGDMATPVGIWRMTRIRYRPDRVDRPRTAPPVQAIKPNDGWCDAPPDRNYNRAVTLPYPTSCEQLWRDDHIYDIFLELNHNVMPRRRGFGSAVFFHLTRPEHSPTAGCVAVDYPDMLRILALLKPHSFLHILA